MILPTKHLREDQALIAVGAELLGLLDEPKTVSRLWEEIRRARGEAEASAATPTDRAARSPQIREARCNIPFDWVILALGLLYLLGAGFDHPERHDANQQIGDQQVAVSYLLGLDWEVPRQLLEVREKENTVRQLRKAAKEGTLGRVIPSAAELRIAERQREQAELDRRRVRIMDLLRAHGALEQLTQLQAELSRAEAEAETLRHALDTDELGFQYIVTLNSDELGKAELPPGFDVRPHLLDVALTDASETSGLFGLRFD